MRKLFLVTMLLLSVGAFADGRKEIVLGEGWQFSRDSMAWQQVSVPHDWAISGPFDKKWDLQFVAIEQNGEKEKTEKSGRSGALPWIGKGYYRTVVHIDRQPSSAVLVFDGAMSEPVVRVNGKEAGRWAYGYNAFRLDVARLLHQGDNTIEVSLNNLEESSRWYPGGGLYRQVKLILGEDALIDDWATFFQTKEADGNLATIEVQTAVWNGQPLNDLFVEVSLYDQRQRRVAAFHTQLDSEGKCSDVLRVHRPRLWSPETPNLYVLNVRLYRNLQLIDEKVQKVGIRTVKVSKEGGFQLNGVTRKIKGVCLHHDLGPLGAAVNKAALIRQIRTMKEMGCDAIRTAHNMPSTWQMEVCDSMGMMVMAESFDMWLYPKCKNGYARFFNNWSERDITNLVLNHRNHPSIVMWSIGNAVVS